VFNSTTSTHVYGADGLRRRTTVGTNVTDYVLDGQSAVRTLLNSAVDKTYLHGPRGPEYERTGAAAPVWNMYDGLGSVVGTVNASGTIVSARKLDVYGSVRQLTGSSGTRHKFVGALGHPSEDETGLIYMRARWMDPVLGRFASEDRARDGHNWFSYCYNNPINLVDPDGKAALGAGLILAALVALAFLGGAGSSIISDLYFGRTPDLGHAGLQGAWFALIGLATGLLTVAGAGAALMAGVAALTALAVKAATIAAAGALVVGIIACVVALTLVACVLLGDPIGQDDPRTPWRPLFD
jgi:RHS repeat-associated protein